MSGRCGACSSPCPPLATPPRKNDEEEGLNLSCTLLYKLWPFFFTVIAYYVFAPGPWKCICKSMPVVTLCCFVVIQEDPLHCPYGQAFLAGLYFAGLGDLMLFYPCCFTWTLLSLSFSHLSYIHGLGFQNLDLVVGAACYTVAGVATLMFSERLWGPYMIAIPIYTVLGMTTVWRAAAKFRGCPIMWDFGRLAALVGSILILASDFLVGQVIFIGTLPCWCRPCIMVFYYFGQLGMALSTVYQGAEFWKPEEPCPKSESPSGRQAMLPSRTSCGTGAIYERACGGN